MANKTLFASKTSKSPRANTINDAGGRAYALSAKQALAQIAATGCFNNTYYARGSDQLVQILQLVNQIDDNQFLARLAIYARKKAFMKDMPAALLVILSSRDTVLTHKIFDQVVDNGRMLRTVFQMVRSGQFGRNGLSSSFQRAFQRWLNEASESKLLSASIGNDPSLRDVMRMARPTPIDNARRATFGWLTGKEVEKWAPATQADLPEIIQRLETYRRTTDEKAQAKIASDLNVRWDLLADAARGPKVWKAIARQMGPQALRMNLNTLQRHGVLEDSAMVDEIAARLKDADAIQRSKQFPYQYFAAYLNVNDEIPQKIKSALHDAAEIACGNIPCLPGPVVIGLDTSGSMTMSATGNRGRGATSKMRCVDVAALFAAAILRRNPDSVVVPFDTCAHEVRVDPGDTILSLSKRLSKFVGGGTNCSIPIAEANSGRLAKRKFAGIVLVSDNESWVGQGRYRSTAVMTEWNKFANRQQGDARLVCIDIQPSTNSQAPDRKDILNVGGFSDSVFNVVNSFLSKDRNRFVDEIEAIKL